MLTDTLIQKTVKLAMREHVSFKSIIKASRTEDFAKVRLSGILGDAPTTVMLKLEDDIVFVSYGNCGLPFTLAQVEAVTL